MHMFQWGTLGVKKLMDPSGSLHYEKLFTQRAAIKSGILAESILH